MRFSYHNHRARKTTLGQRNLRVERLEDRSLLSTSPVGVPSGVEPVGSLDSAYIGTETELLDVRFSVSDDWNTGFVMSGVIENDGPSFDKWTLEMDFNHNITNIWNAAIVEHVGNHYVITGKSWNSMVATGQSVSFGFQGATGEGDLTPTNITLNGIPIGGGQTELPKISINDVSVTEPDLMALNAGFFHTEGNQIVDSEGRTVRIAGVSWFGLESNNFTPHGLWTRRYTSMMDQIKEAGFNTIRLPFCNELLHTDKAPTSINYALNPELKELSSLEIMDEVVNYAGKIGLRIILDNHRSDAGIGAEGTGLWYTAEYTDAQWASDWRMLAERYAGNPTVIGADLFNEPHGPCTWGSGDPATDWRLAAERAGNAIGEVNPDWLIFVEGIEYHDGGNYWWGGNLSGVANNPVRLNVEGRLVYSPHAYPASIYHQNWFNDPAFPDNLPEIWNANWGYIFHEEIAPVLLGEFGSKLINPLDELWMDKMVGYLGGDLHGDGASDLGASQQGISWTYWSWNPNSGDTGGILMTDWRTIDQQKLDKVKSQQFEFPDTSNSGDLTVAEKAIVTFEVTLSIPSSREISINFETVDDTAVEGEDYVSKSGTLIFSPGERTKTISVTIIGDKAHEATDQFFMNLTDAVGATIEDSRGIAMILDNDSEVEPIVPDLSVEDVTITEPDSNGVTTANFIVCLSESSDQTITVKYSTADISAVVDSDYRAESGVVTFAPGETNKTISVAIIGDLVTEPNEKFALNLTDASGAHISDALGTATIRDNDARQFGDVVFHLRDNWGAGCVVDVDVHNNSSKTTQGWILEFDFDGEIVNIWNANIIKHTGNHYVIASTGWNGTIEAGKSTKFGFQATPGDLDVILINASTKVTKPEDRES